MPRTVSFDHPDTGKGNSDYFKVTGTKEHPQRIAMIPGEALAPELIVTDALRAKAQAGDKEAREKIEEIVNLKEIITSGLSKRPPSAELYVPEDATEKVILYSKMVAANTFWVEGAGYVYYKEGIPEEIIAKLKNPPGLVYSMVVIEYNLDAENGIAVLAPDRQIDLGHGHKLDFKYTMKQWQLRDSQIRAWKTHTRNSPMIFSDYEVWEEQSGAYKKMVFSPAGYATWRGTPQNPNMPLIHRMIKEARKAYANLSKNIAKDFTVEEIIKMFPELNLGGASQASSGERMMPTEETDFAALLGAAPSTPTPTPAPSNGNGVQEAPSASSIASTPPPATPEPTTAMTVETQPSSAQ